MKASSSACNGEKSLFEWLNLLTSSPKAVVCSTDRCTVWTGMLKCKFILSDLLEIQFEPEAAGTLILSGNEAHLQKFLHRALQCKTGRSVAETKSMRAVNSCCCHRTHGKCWWVTNGQPVMRGWSHVHLQGCSCPAMDRAGRAHRTLGMEICSSLPKHSPAKGQKEQLIALGTLLKGCHSQGRPSMGDSWDWEQDPLS